MHDQDPNDDFGADILVPWDGNPDNVPLMMHCQYDELAALDSWTYWSGDQPTHGVADGWWSSYADDENYGEAFRRNHRIAGYCVEPGIAPWGSKASSAIIDLDELGGKHLDLCRMAFLSCCHHMQDYALSG
jgi:hypothetical protein